MVYGKLRRSASFSKLRASLRRSSAKLMQKLTNRGASTIEGYSNSMKRASSLSVLSGHNTEQHTRSNVASLRGRTASTEQLLLQNATAVGFTHITSKSYLSSSVGERPRAFRTLFQGNFSCCSFYALTLAFSSPLRRAPEEGIGDHMVLGLVKPIYSCLLLRVKDEIRFSAECDKEEVYLHLRGGRVVTKFRESILSICDRASKPNLPIIGGQVYCESGALDRVATDAETDELLLSTTRGAWYRCALTRRIDLILSSLLSEPELIHLDIGRKVVFDAYADDDSLGVDSVHQEQRIENTGDGERLHRLCYTGANVLTFHEFGDYGRATTETPHFIGARCLNSTS
uniref:(California timema) hypothetical protein n=1 Tax=Timema californicum TaxID=61474 RepID=A0A7R9J3B9_TIMCA|nr:unnamed protein product [Timema californicum]